MASPQLDGDISSSPRTTTRLHGLRTTRTTFLVKMSNHTLTEWRVSPAPYSFSNSSTTRSWISVTTRGWVTCSARRFCARYLLGNSPRPGQSFPAGREARRHWGSFAVLAPSKLSSYAVTIPGGRDARRLESPIPLAPYPLGAGSVRLGWSIRVALSNWQSEQLARTQVRS